MGAPLVASPYRVRNSLVCKAVCFYWGAFSSCDCDRLLAGVDDANGAFRAGGVPLQDFGSSRGDGSARGLLAKSLCTTRHRWPRGDERASP